ncbi:MAG: NADPH:quinone reductase [Thermoleophilaceae bacterium]|nr:NADPH:quinone reductase [Thermoleophilaceae bacterium]
MRAIQLSEWGGPEVLELVQLEVPEPGPDEVLIRVARAGINFADTHQRENSYVAKYELPFVPGGEVVGIVERGAGDLAAGRRVLAMTGSGGYAEYATAPLATTYPLPDEVDDGTALALLIQGLTAWHLYRTQSRLREGESVVVISAAGGVGSLAVQLAKPFGAGRVIATAGSEDRRALALELGADVALDPDAGDLTEALIDANGGRQVDVVLEMAGGPVFDACLNALAPFGRVVVYGISSREQNELRTGSLLRRSRAVVGFWLMHLLERPEMLREPLADLLARAARGELRTVVGETYALSEVRRAHEDLQGRRTSGKLLLDPSG